MVEKELKFLATPEKGEVSALLVRPEGATRLHLVLGHGASTTMRHATLRRSPSAGRGRHRDLPLQLPLRRARQGPRLAGGVHADRPLGGRRGPAASPDLPLLAGGHSFGGRMTSTAASESPLEGVCGLVFFSFPLHQPGKPETQRAEHLASVTVPMLFLSGIGDELAEHGPPATGLRGARPPRDAPRRRDGRPRRQDPQSLPRLRGARLRRDGPRRP